MQATAPAKIILFGEHAVVYGKPAIAVPVSSLRATASIQNNPLGKQGLEIVAPDINLRLLMMDIGEQVFDDAIRRTVQLALNYFQEAPPNVTITLHSTIPIASGLGSGAAISTALARAIGIALSRPIEDDQLNEIVYEVEKLHHGTPSGIDNTVIVYERPVYFVRNQPIQPLSIGHDFSLLIGDTGQGALTRIAVSDVRKLYDKDSAGTRIVLDAIEAIVLQARKVIESGSPMDLGVLMNQNHTLLQQLTVSSPKLDKLVQVALQAGAAGAKLSGGGRGGNMIALVTPNSAAQVRNSLLQAGAVRVFETVVK